MRHFILAQFPSLREMPLIATLCGSDMTVENLQKEINLVFNGIARPDVSLYQLKLTDEKGMSCEITNDEWSVASSKGIARNWQDIPDEAIAECGCLLAHTEPESYIYYLPAYMRFSLKYLDSKESKYDLAGMVVFSLTPSRNEAGLREYVISQMSLLNASQKQAVVKFIEYVAAHGSEFDRIDAQRSLERYWYGAVTT